MSAAACCWIVGAMRGRETRNDPFCIPNFVQAGSIRVISHRLHSVFHGVICARVPHIVWQNMNLTWLAAGVVVLVLGLLIAGYVRSPLHGWKRLAAMLCKTAALALLALCLLNPLWAPHAAEEG